MAEEKGDLVGTWEGWCSSILHMMIERVKNTEMPSSQPIVKEYSPHTKIPTDHKSKVSTENKIYSPKELEDKC